ncbi:hypothetical protein QR680_017588 [Steinernema hermaphroditum]|uniref:Uncharacterized protein n=1 Tax=Steinernema hermaphroditum TaxID=289476 RepID=A0AA39HF50_9BILA|nr:hypothetical protein QR680_017588 [Steinernema hermaphroditum]
MDNDSLAAPLGVPDAKREIDAPVGPFSATELADGRILCFEEKSNRVVSIDVSDAQKRCSYVVAKQFSFENYYWSQILSVTSDIILCLLKQHKSKMFYLVSFRLNDKKKTVSAICKRRTRIRAQGYRVSSQRGDNGTFYFGFCSPTSSSDSNASWRKVSDRKLFLNQMKNDAFAESSKPTVMSVSSTDSSSSDCSNSQPDDESVTSATNYESVILQTTCEANGQIGARILSLGKERLEIALRENLDEVVKRKTPLTSNYMTELPHSNLSDPFFFKSQAVIIDRTDPSIAYAIKTVDGPENGIFAAFQAKLKAITGMTPNSQQIVFRQIKIDCTAGKPSSGNTIWSNVTTHYRTGSAYCYVQDRESDTCSLWRLELDQSSASDSESCISAGANPAKEEVNHPIVEVHSDMEGTDLRRKSMSKNCRTLVRMDSDGTVTPETHKRVPSTSTSRGSSSTHSTYDEISLEPYPQESTPLEKFRWVPLGESHDNIGDNIVLRLEESTGLCCVRSTRKPSNGREDSRHCFILFPSQAPTSVC